ncbi:unnamed protein product, partial [Pelagomonas calceolata]
HHHHQITRNTSGRVEIHSASWHRLVVVVPDHRLLHDAVHGHPRGLRLGVEGVAQGVAKRRDQRLADDRVVLRHDAVADVLRAEARQDRHELVELREHADGRLDRGHNLSRVRLEGLLREERVVDLGALDPAEAEERQRLRRDAEDVLEQDDAGRLVRHARVDDLLP